MLTSCIFLALCPPTNLTGHVSCDANALTLTWDPVTGAIYVLQYEQIGSALPHSANVTSNSSHTLANLLCGQRYAFRIAAQDGNCRSSYSPPIEISTGNECFHSNGSKSCCGACITHQLSFSFSPLSAHKLNGPSGLWDKQWEFFLG